MNSQSEERQDQSEWVFDPQSQYYYNSRTDQYSYWDGQQWHYTGPGSSSHTSQSASIWNGQGPSEGNSRGGRGGRSRNQDRTRDRRDQYKSRQIYDRDRDYERSTKRPKHEDGGSRRITTLRLVKIKSGILPNEKKVAVIDINGVSIGRDRSYDAKIRLPEMATSKFHCHIFYEGTGEEPGFKICDSGSVNGTFLDKAIERTNDVVEECQTSRTDETKPQRGIRLSKSKEASKPFLLSHLDHIFVGTTEFEVHLHSKVPCEECTVKDDNQISLTHPKDNESGPTLSKVQTQTQDSSADSTASWLAMKATVNSKTNKPLKKRAQLDEIRKLQLEQMRAEFEALSDGEEETKKEALDSHYTDRAALRRKQYGQSDKPAPSSKKRKEKEMPNDVESASIVTPISQENKGHVLLSKMGWQAGSSLSGDVEDNRGILEPIAATTMAAERAGIGNTQVRPGEEKRWGGTSSSSKRNKSSPGFFEWKNKTKDALARRYEELNREEDVETKELEFE